MAFDGRELLQRCAAIQEQVIAGCDAVPYFWHVQEGTPYWTNRLADIAVDFNSEDYDLTTVNVIMRLILGHVTEGGYSGESEQRLLDYIPDVLEYFNERQLLQSASYLTALTHLVEARIVSCSGYTQFSDSGDGTAKVGTEFTLRCQFEYEIVQTY